MLAAGGNAFDAGVAAVFAAAVNEISHFGLGGEAPAIVFQAASGKVTVICGQGTAPKAATPAHFRAAGVIPGNGPNGGTVPAVVDAMALTLQHFGTMSLAQVLEPAIQLADGFPMYGVLRRSLLMQPRKTRERWEWSRRTYYPEGRIPEVGEIFRQPNLAATLRAIAAAERAALEQGARPREGHRGRARCVLQGRCGPPHRRRRAGRRRVAELRGSRHLSRAARSRGQHALPGLRHPQGRLLEPGPDAAADAEHPRGRRHRQDAPWQRAVPAHARRSDQAGLRRSQCLVRRSAVRRHSRRRPAVEELRRRARGADRRAGFAAAPLRQSLRAPARRPASRCRVSCRTGSGCPAIPPATPRRSRSWMRAAICSAARRVRAG